MTPRSRGIVSTRSFGVVADAQVEPPLEGGLADLPGTIADNAIEQNAAIVLAVSSLVVRELHEFGRKLQGL